MVTSDVGIPFHLIRNSPSATTGNDWSIPTTPSVQPLFQDLLSTEEGGLETWFASYIFLIVNLEDMMDVVYSLAVEVDTQQPDVL